LPFCFAVFHLPSRWAVFRLLFCFAAFHLPCDRIVSLRPHGFPLPVCPLTMRRTPAHTRFPPCGLPVIDRHSTRLCPYRKRAERGLSGDLNLSASCRHHRIDQRNRQYYLFRACSVRLQTRLHLYMILLYMLHYIKYERSKKQNGCIRIRFVKI
jgi:hypothetical protein